MEACTRDEELIIDEILVFNVARSESKCEKDINP